MDLSDRRSNFRLAWLNLLLDPTLPITPIPKGNQNDTVTQERLQEIKTEISNSKQLEQKSSQNWPRSRALFKPCVPSDSAIRNDDLIRKHRSGGPDLAESILRKYSQRVLRSASERYSFAAFRHCVGHLFYCWCLNKLNSRAILKHCKLTTF